jgi:hypothetical protein
MTSTDGTRAFVANSCGADPSTWPSRGQSITKAPGADGGVSGDLGSDRSAAMPRACCGVSPARYGGPSREAAVALSALSLRLTEQFVQLGLNVDEVGFLAGRHDRVRALEKVGDLLDRGLEVGLAERGGKLDVQHAAARPVR